MKLHLGCGKDHIDGFINCDIQKIEGVDKVINCSDLRCFEPESTDLIFAHSFFEHLYIPEEGRFLLEAKRILKKEGLLFLLGIPDFKEIARLYTEQAPGITPFYGTFNLYQAYRLTHGDYMDEKGSNIPQLHKTIFDKPSLVQLFSILEYKTAVIFNYTFPKEEYRIPIGIIASPEDKIVKERIKELLNEFRKYFNDIQEIISPLNRHSPTLPYLEGSITL